MRWGSSVVPREAHLVAHPFRCITRFAPQSRLRVRRFLPPRNHPSLTKSLKSSSQGPRPWKDLTVPWTPQTLLKHLNKSPQMIAPSSSSNKKQNGKNRKDTHPQSGPGSFGPNNQHTRNPETIRKASRKKPTAVVSREPKQSCTACGLKLERL